MTPCMCIRQELSAPTIYSVSYTHLLIIVISLIIGLLVTASLILFLVKKISPKTNISELAARTRSWWIMSGMFIGAVFISYNISYVFLAFLSFIAFRELYSVLGFREADRGALFWGILSIPIQYYLAYLCLLYTSHPWFWIFPAFTYRKAYLSPARAGSLKN